MESKTDYKISDSELIYQINDNNEISLGLTIKNSVIDNTQFLGTSNNANGAIKCIGSTVDIDNVTIAKIAKIDFFIFFYFKLLLFISCNYHFDVNTTKKFN